MTHVFGSERSPEALLRAVQHEVTRAHEAQSESHLSPRPKGLTVALSCQVGAGEGVLAREIGSRLGWPVYDRELLERIAREMNVRVSMLESVDQHHISWLREVFETFAAVPHVNENSYVRHLVETLLSLAAIGNCVILGRGAAVVLPPASTLRLRMVGILEDRIAAIARERGLSQAEAARYVEDTERDRDRFIRDHFQKNIERSEQFHLTLNVSRLTVGECADIAVDALHRMQTRNALETSVVRQEAAAVFR